MFISKSRHFLHDFFLHSLNSNLYLHTEFYKEKNIYQHVNCCWLGYTDVYLIVFLDILGKEIHIYRW